MNTLTPHTDQSAPAAASAVLAKVKDRYGFIPNLAAYVAESPAALNGLMALAGSFDATSLSPQEQQVVQLTVSVLNGCAYCRTVHAALGRKAALDDATLQACISLTPLPDARLNALRDFTRQVVEERGWVSEAAVAAFLGAGHTRAQVFEVLLGVAMKTFTNYSNHLVGTSPNASFVDGAQGLAWA
jgi:uncharacterized peroxidase-related enzyme